MYPYNISVATRAEKLLGGEEQLKSVYSRLSDECFMLAFQKIHGTLVVASLTDFTIRWSYL